MLAFRYIAYHYLKYFFIILGALVLFMVGFDYMGNMDSLPKSANLLVIYLVYKSFFAIDMILPMALVFAMISTKIYLIRSNALVSFFSLGYSRVDVLKPFIVVSTVIIMLFIGLHTSSSFAHAKEYASNIVRNSQYLSPTRDLFFTYKGQFVYFSKMIPLQQRAENIRLFSVKDGSLKEVLIAKLAIYRDGSWYIKSADIITKPDDLSATSHGIEISKGEDLKILHGFRPKILDQIYEGRVDFTVGDAIDAIWILDEQNINTSTIKGALYKIFIYPFFAPLLIIIIFFFVPMSVRFLNVSLFSFGAILSTLLIWALLFVLMKLSDTKTIPSEIGIILPIVILLLIALRQYRYYGDRA
jgi:lipopolysaccharide export system permease protein